MIDKNKLVKGLFLIVGIIVLVSLLTQVGKKNSMTLEDYARENPEIAYQTKEPDAETTENLQIQDANTTASDSNESQTDKSTIASAETASPEATPPESTQPSTPETSLIGATLNGDSLLEQRTSYEEGFYYEPLSENLRRFITGVSYPAIDESGDTQELAITYDELTYLHVLHYDFDGNPAEGELICNKAIAQDLVEIFYELYRNEYQLEKVLLIDEYDGDDTASMEDNNTSCFNYRVVEGSTSLSKHALGLALDINPLYNPYITYEKDGSERVSPVAALDYADRDASFPYKIDENDLCYKLFIEHGFTWGGNWNRCKDYQHFQKVMK